VPRAAIWVRVGGYLSIVLLLLAALGLVARGRRGLKAVLAAWALLVFARMYDQPPLLGDVLGVLPNMGQIQFYRYATAAFELPVILLAALGIDDLTRVAAHRRRLVWGALGALATIAGAVFVAEPVLDTLQRTVHHGATFFQVSIAWGVLTAVAVGIIAIVRGARVRAALLVLVVVVDAVVLFAVPQFSAPRATRIDLTPVTYLRQHVGNGRFFTLGPIAPDYGSYFRLASIGVDDFPPKSYARFVHRRLDPFDQFVGFRAHGPPSAERELMRHLNGYRAAGVRYVLTPAGHPLPTRPAFTLVFRSPTTWIYRLNGAKPYFSAPGCSVTSGDRASVRVFCPQSTTLIRRETWFSGWSAQLDGHPTPIRGVGGVFQAVTVPAGSHRISFSFEPVGMDLALLGALLGFALLVAPWAPELTARARVFRLATASLHPR
jgi:hypothetical protein